MKPPPNDLLLASRADTGLDLEALLSEAAEAAVWIDHNWIARYCNQTYASNLGLTPEQVIGRTPFEYTLTG